MTRRLALFLFATIPALVAADIPLHIATRGARPLRQACWAIKEQVHWRMSFEEAPVLSDAELDTKLAPTGRTMYFRRAIPLSFDTFVPAAQAKQDTKQQVMDALLAAYNKGASATYRYVSVR